MARIRSIKPEFFRHEGLQDLELSHPGNHCMLVFAGLWIICDRAGRFQWRPRTLKLDILPFLDFDMAQTLSLLEGAGFLACYQVDGECYGMIPTWDKHQTAESLKHERERYPEMDESSRIDPKGFVKHPGQIKDASHTFPGHVRESSGKEKERERERERKVQQQPCILESPDGATAPNPVSPAEQAVAVEVVKVIPKQPKPKKLTQRSQKLSIALLSMSDTMAEAFQRVADAWPKEGWNYATKSASPRKTNLALAAERFKAICDDAPIRTANGPLTAEDLAEAALAWVGKRRKEAGPAGVPCVPCIENFFSADATSKKHWQNALLDFFGVAP